MRSWGKLWTMRYKKPKNPTATSEMWSGAKTGYYTGTLHTAPPRREPDHASHPSSPWTPLHPHSTQRTSSPAPQASEQEKLLLVFAPWCPNKDLPELRNLIWPLLDFHWLKDSKNPGGSQQILQLTDIDLCAPPPSPIFILLCLQCVFRVWTRKVLINSCHIKDTEERALPSTNLFGAQVSWLKWNDSNKSGFSESCEVMGVEGF